MMRNLADAVRRAAERDPLAPALISHRRRLSWGELDARIDEVAAGLRALSLTTEGPHPARVAVALPNVSEFAIAFFAALRAGLVALPVNHGYTTRELRHVLADAGVSVVVGTAAVCAAIQPVRSSLPTLTHVYSVGSGEAAGAAPFAALGRAEGPVMPTTGDEDLAVLLYTSGTEGDPKGAMLTHRALIANHRQLDEIDPPVITSGDIVLLALPMFHAYGLNSGLGAVAWHGACGVLAERFDPADTLNLIARHRVSVVAAVPQMFAAWSMVSDVGTRMSSVRVAVSGAAPLEAEASRRLVEAIGHPVHQGYGLTETAPVVTTSLASPVPKPGSIGRPVPYAEVKLVGADGTEIVVIGSDGVISGDLDDFDDDVPGTPGTDPGEIVVRGPNLFSGYWPEGRDGPDEHGWWATGDVAYADADGDLFLVDRLGELILVSGFNVYPHEVELVLASYPGVVEAAVVGVSHPYTGEAIKAFVVADPDAGAVSAEDLIAHCERNLARFKCPNVIEFVPELPHSPTGKVRKSVLLSETATDG